MNVFLIFQVQVLAGQVGNTACAEENTSPPGFLLELEMFSLLFALSRSSLPGLPASQWKLGMWRALAGGCCQPGASRLAGIRGF